MGSFRKNDELNGVLLKPIKMNNLPLFKRKFNPKLQK